MPPKRVKKRGKVLNFPFAESGRVFSKGSPRLPPLLFKTPFHLKPFPTRHNWHECKRSIPFNHPFLPLAWRGYYYLLTQRLPIVALGEAEITLGQRGEKKIGNI